MDVKFKMFPFELVPPRSPWYPSSKRCWGEITFKGTKRLVDSQFFMYHVYFENVSHIASNH
jgi:hypothetical protein